jgi:hypothetical protein
MRLCRYDVAARTGRVVDKGLDLMQVFSSRVQCRTQAGDDAAVMW